MKDKNSNIPILNPAANDIISPSSERRRLFGLDAVRPSICKSADKTGLIPIPFTSIITRHLSKLIRMPFRNMFRSAEDYDGLTISFAATLTLQKLHDSTEKSSSKASSTDDNNSLGFSEISPLMDMKNPVVSGKYELRDNDTRRRLSVIKELEADIIELRYELLSRCKEEENKNHHNSSILARIISS